MSWVALRIISSTGIVPYLQRDFSLDVLLEVFSVGVPLAVSGTYWGLFTS